MICVICPINFTLCDLCSQPRVVTTDVKAERQLNNFFLSKYSSIFEPTQLSPPEASLIVFSVQPGVRPAHPAMFVVTRNPTLSQ